MHQCALLGISRSSLYYQPTGAGAQDLELMALMDRQYLKTPFYGSRRMTVWLRTHCHAVNRKRVRRLMHGECSPSEVRPSSRYAGVPRSPRCRYP